MTSDLWHSCSKRLLNVRNCSVCSMHWHARACTNDYECMGTSLEVLLAYNTNFIWLQTFCLGPLPSPEGCSMRASCSACMAVSTKILWKCDSQIPTDLSGWFHPPQLLPRYPVDASASHGVSFHPSPDSTFHGVCRGSRTNSPSNRWDIQQLLLQKVKIKINNINCWSFWRQIIWKQDSLHNHMRCISNFASYIQFCSS